MSTPKPTPGYAIVAPNGFIWPSTHHQRGWALTEFRLAYPSWTWVSAYRKGWRCIKVTVAPA